MPLFIHLSHKRYIYFVLLCLSLLFVFTFLKEHANYGITRMHMDDGGIVKKKLDIALLVVLTGARVSNSYYKIASDSLRCYAKIQGYRFITVDDADYIECKQPDMYFRRHCVVSLIMERSSFDYAIFLDGDIGVANPNRRIEDYIDEKFNITFYDRFWNWEIMAGSYIAKNTPWTRKFLKGWANYNYRIPKGYDGTDNGAIHAYVAEVLYPHRQTELKICLDAYQKAKTFNDLFVFEGCIRTMLGTNTDFGAIRILQKGNSWARDGNILNHVWNPQRDFMLHGWKGEHLNISYPQEKEYMKRCPHGWCPPINGHFDLPKCTPTNKTWSYKSELIVPIDWIEAQLKERYYGIERWKFRSLAELPKLLDSEYATKKG